MNNFVLFFVLAAIGIGLMTNGYGNLGLCVIALFPLLAVFNRKRIESAERRTQTALLRQIVNDKK